MALVIGSLSSGVLTCFVAAFLLVKRSIESPPEPVPAGSMVRHARRGWLAPFVERCYDSGMSKADLADTNRIGEMIKAVTGEQPLVDVATVHPMRREPQEAAQSVSRTSHVIAVLRETVAQDSPAWSAVHQQLNAIEERLSTGLQQLLSGLEAQLQLAS